MARPWTSRLLACLALGGVALTGCSATTEASESLPSSTSASPTTQSLPPVGPKDFPVPAEAREKTPEGALAFAKYYMALGIQIGKGKAKPQALLDLSYSCQLCRRVALSFEEDRAAEYTHVGSSFSFEEYGPPRISGDSAELGFVYSQGAYRVVDAEGHDVPSRAVKATGKLQSGMLLKWDDSLHSWLVTSLTVG